MSNAVAVFDFDPEDPSTWTRYSEDTPDGGKIVLVRYSEGYRLRCHGETVWIEVPLRSQKPMPLPPRF